jgi:hypothetical protein
MTHTRGPVKPRVATEEQRRRVDEALTRHRDTLPEGWPHNEDQVDEDDGEPQTRRRGV